MEESEDKRDMNIILCPICDMIKKIKINSNWEEKTINILFECDHERSGKAKSIKDNYCINCVKYIEQDKECKKLNHEIIKNEDLYFYCKEHVKKFNGYCEECAKNICDECICQHKNVKNRFEYYFSFFQLEELVSAYDEAKNVISMIYSLNCNIKISEEFENYYNIYKYMYDNDFFHIIIIYNINLFYNYFKFLTKSKLIHTGFFTILEINNIKDNTIFYDTYFKSQFAYLMDMKDFNFNNLLNLFLLSKRFKTKPELSFQFSEEMYSLIFKNTLKSDNIDNDKINYEKYFNILRNTIYNKKTELMSIQYKITNLILSIKLLKIAVPSNFKKKLIAILQREIIKKYRNHLHKIKPNTIILNNIKKRYESFKKKDKNSFQALNLAEKVNTIDNIVPEKDYTFIDNVYFENKFDNKILLNTFLFFTQKLHTLKSNETHYSNSEEGKKFHINQIIDFPNNGKNSKINKNLNNSDEVSNSNIQLNNRDNKDSINLNGNINERIADYKILLNEYKNNFDNSYKDILIKKTLSFECIMDALFNNDFSNIIDSTKNENKNSEFDKLINECLDELNVINYEKDENQKKLIKVYSQIKSNKLQVKRGKIFSVLIHDRKYKDIMEKIKQEYDKDDEDAKNKYNENLIQLLITLGGFDMKNAEQIITIIEKYLYYSKEIETLDEEMEKDYSDLAKENSELALEIIQLKKIGNYIEKVNEDIKYLNANYELNEMCKIKNNFEKKSDYYINKDSDINYNQALKEIKEYIKENDIQQILNSLKIICKDIESNFYVDETLNLASYCWAIQNGHDYIADS